jgi:outer membrane protein assembly factor BamA
VRSRRTRRAALALAAAAVTALAAGLFPQEPLRGLVEGRLRLAFGPGSRLGGLHVVPARLSVEVERLVLDAPGFRLEVPRARAALAPRVPTADVIALRSLEVESPRLIVRHATAAPGPSEPARLPRLSIDVVALTDGLVVVEAPSSAVEIRGLEAHGSLGPAGLSVTAREARLGTDDPARIVAPLAARLRVSPEGDIELADATAGYGAASRVRASGPLVRGRALAPALRLDAAVELSDLGAFGAPVGSHGALTLSGSAAMTPSGDVSAQARGTGADLRLGTLSLDRIEIEARHAGGRSEVEASAGLLGGRGSARATLDADDLLVVKAHAEELSLPALARLVPEVNVTGLDGRLSARLDTTGRVSGPWKLDGRWDADGSLPQVPRWSAGGTTAGELRTGPRASLDVRWDAEADADAIEGDGGLAMRGLHVSAHGRLSGPETLGIDADLRLTADARTPAAEGPLRLDATASVSGDRRAVSLDAGWLGASARGEARLLRTRIDSATLRVTGLDLAALASGARGSLEIAGVAGGTLERPTFDLNAEGRDIIYEGVPLGPLRARLEGDLVAARLDATLPEVPARLAGTVRLAEGQELRARLSLDDASLERLRSLWPEAGLEGRVSASADLTVPLAQPERLRLGGTVSAFEAAGGDSRASGEAQRAWRARSLAPIGLSYAAGVARIESLDIAGSGLALRGDLSLDTSGDEGRLGGALSASADLGSLPLATDWKASGSVGLDVQLGGSMARPQLTGNLTLDGVEVSSATLPEISLPGGRLSLSGGALEAESLRALLAGGEISLSGRVPFASLITGARKTEGTLAPEERARLQLAWKDLDLGGLTAAVRPVETSLEGRVSGEARIEGGLARLAEIEGRVSTAPLVARVGDLDLTVTPVSLGLDSGVARLVPLTVTTSAGALTLEGSADLARSELDFASRGSVELRALSPFMGEASLTGTGVVDVRVSGPFDDLRPRGSLRVDGATLRLRLLRDALTGVRGTLTFDGHVLRVEDVSGAFGGGAVTLTGGADIAGSSLRDVIVQLTARDVALRYPPGLRSRLDADLGLAGDWGRLELAGVARVQRGLYDLDVAFGEAMREVEQAATGSPLLQSIGLDVRVDLVNPIAVRNSFADLRVDGSLVFRGDMNEPTPFGRLELRPGGKVSLQQKAFEIESGRLVYEGTWDPGIEVRGSAEITGTDPLGRRNDYRVVTTASGSLERPALSFSSTPPLSENEIVSLIATGQTGSQALSAGAALAGEQAAALLAGGLTRGLSEGLRGLGLDEVQIQPEIVARELTPGARFTFRKQLLREAALTYSASLKYPEERFLQLDVKPGLGITAFGQQRDDGTSTVGAGQRFRFGGGEPATAKADAAEATTRIGEVRISGVPEGVEEAELRGRLRARQGRRVSSWELQEDADRLRDALRERDYLEAEAGARLEGGDVAVFDLQPGPRYSNSVEGWPTPSGFAGELRSGLFEDEARERGEAVLRRELARAGHPTASISSEARVEGASRRIVFRVEPGPRYTSVRWSFPGARELSSEELRRAAGDVADVLASPAAAAQRIRDAYAARHYLAATAGPLDVSREGGVLALTLPVTEGPHARVREVRVEGTLEDAPALLAAAAFAAGAPYDEVTPGAAALRVRDRLLSEGFPWARVVVETAPVPPDVDVVFRVDHGRQLRIGRVEIEGLGATRESLVRSRLPLRPGEPLDPRALQRAERDLLGLGTFARVSITFSNDDESLVKVSLVEDARFLARYDLRYNEDEKGQAIVDAEARNLFGRGIVIGARQSVSADVLESRASLSLPVSLWGRGSFTASGFRIEEDIEGGLGTSLQRGVEVQRAQPLPGRFTLLAGYRFKRVAVADFTPVDVAGLDFSLFRDTRDSALDARRGGFLSLNVQLSPKKLGSDFDFLKGYVQAFFSKSFGDGLTWAQGYRLGLSHVYGGEPLVSSERFRAGGTNSVRGYETDSLGPVGFLGDPAGGQAVLVLNQELRYRHPSGLGLAAFWDAGNVFAKTTDLGFDLQHALGLGLRYDSPVGLLRLDVGFPLNKREADKTYRLHFSLGQAF